MNQKNALTEEDIKLLWKLPDDLKEKIVKGKRPISKKEGEISKYIGVALARLETHREMRAIVKQIHPSTKYHDLRKAIAVYLNATQENTDKVCEGRIHILDLIKKEKVKELPIDIRKNWVLYKNVKEVQQQLNVFYKNLKPFIEGTPEDRKFLIKYLKAEKILYIASLLSCIRDEELWESFLKHQKIREVL